MGSDLVPNGVSVSFGKPIDLGLRPLRVSLREDFALETAGSVGEDVPPDSAREVPSVGSSLSTSHQKVTPSPRNRARPNRSPCGLSAAGRGSVKADISRVNSQTYADAHFGDLA